VSAARTLEPRTSVVWGVLGDDSTAMDRFTGENIYRPRTGRPVLMEVGQQVFNLNGDLLSSHGPNELIGALYGLDPHGLHGICSALSARREVAKTVR